MCPACLGLAALLAAGAASTGAAAALALARRRLSNSDGTASPDAAR